MNFLFKKLFICLSLTLLLPVMNIFAATTPPTLEEIKQREIEINNLYVSSLEKTYSIDSDNSEAASVTVESIYLTLDSNYIIDNQIDIYSEQFEQEIIDELNMLNNSYNNMKMNIEENLSPTKAPGTRTAKVWCGVPAIGHGYIMTDYYPEIIHNKFQGATFRTDSYDEGIKLGKWTHIDQWTEIIASGSQMEIIMKGQLDYTLNLGLITTIESFKYTDNKTH